MILELRPEESTDLHSRADAEGVGVETVLRRFVARIAPASASEAQGKWELTEKQKALAALLQSWREEDQTDDPEELAERDRELEKFKANMNRCRAEEGRPSAY